MSTLLGIDTSTALTVVAVCGPDGEPLAPGAEISIDPGADGRPRHGPELIAAIEDAVAAGGGWEGIGRIAVGIGPGSFTGIRIGVATARALAQARELPIAGVESTAALALGIPPEPDRARLGVIDARRGEVFAALAEAGAERAGPPLLSPPEALGESLQIPSGTLAAGEGAVRFRSELEAAGAVVAADGDPVHRLSARPICRIGAAAEAGPPENVMPLYLRRPDAERWRQRDGHN